MKLARVLLIAVLLLQSWLPCWAQELTPRREDVFTVELLTPQGEKIERKKVRLRFAAESAQLETLDGVRLKQLPYAEIKAVTYSYANQPRAKESVAVTAAGVALGSSVAVLSVTPLLPLVIIIGGFRLAKLKGRSHWLTVQGSTDYAVLRLSKDNQRLITTAIETYTNVKVEVAPEGKKSRRNNQ